MLLSTPPSIPDSRVRPEGGPAGSLNLVSISDFSFRRFQFQLFIALAQVLWPACKTSGKNLNMCVGITAFRAARRTHSKRRNTQHDDGHHKNQKSKGGGYRRPPPNGFKFFNAHPHVTPIPTILRRGLRELLYLSPREKEMVDDACLSQVNS